MEFPDIAAADLTPDQHRIWLVALLTAMGEHSDQLVPVLADDVVEALLYYLVTALDDCQAETGQSWRRMLRLD